MANKVIFKNWIRQKEGYRETKENRETGRQKIYFLMNAISKKTKVDLVHDCVFYSILDSFGTV